MRAHEVSIRADKLGTKNRSVRNEITGSVAEMIKGLWLQ